MAYYNQGYQPSPAPQNAANLQFYPSSYGSSVSGHTTPSQASYGGYGGGGAATNAYPAFGTGAPPAFGTQGVSGRMGEQGGLRTGWIAAFSTEGYEGEPGLMEELGVNFGHIKTKVIQRYCQRLKMTVLIPSSLDPSSLESSFETLPAHNGRLGPLGRPYICLRIRRLPCPFRKVRMGLHLRYRPLRQHRSALDLRPDDTPNRPS